MGRVARGTLESCAWRGRRPDLSSVNRGPSCLSFIHMIRRDYILRMIEEFIQQMARIRFLKQEQRWEAAATALDEEFRKLTNLEPAGLARLSETELLAVLMREGPTQVVRHKTLMLTTLLHEAAEVAFQQGREQESRDCRLKALHLLLDILARAEVFELPEFVPKVDILVAELRSDLLPTRTHAMLMQHYERAGEFAKAEDALFSMLEAEPNNARIPEFGMAFYERLLSQSDAALAEGNLPRKEIEQAIRDFRDRLPKSEPPTGHQ